MTISYIVYKAISLAAGANNVDNDDADDPRGGAITEATSSQPLWEPQRWLLIVIRPRLFICDSKKKKTVPDSRSHYSLEVYVEMYHCK